MNPTYLDLFFKKKWGTMQGGLFSFYIGNREKIGFPMPAAENGFQILNLHPPKNIEKQKKTFLMDIYPNNTKDSEFRNRKKSKLACGVFSVSFPLCFLRPCLIHARMPDWGRAFVQ